jgi:hypothetical protein
VPAVIVLRSKRRLDAFQHLGAALAKDRPWLPRHVLAKELRRIYRWSRAKVPKSGYSTDRGLAEEIAAILALQMRPHQAPGSNAAQKPDGYEAQFLSAHDIALLAVSA